MKNLFYLFLALAISCAKKKENQTEQSTTHQKKVTKTEEKGYLHENGIVCHAQSPINILSFNTCLLYTSPSPRDQRGSRMPSSA